MKKHLLWALGLLALATGAQANEAIIKKARCVACHAVDQKRVGPSYLDVAAKYRQDSGAEARLMAKVRNGGTGVWGEVPMPPNPVDRLSDEDLKKAVQWILGLK